MISENYIFHKELNPKLWDTSDKLRPEVREKIIEIVEKFEDSSNIPLNIIDVQLVGSNASYNYTDISDLDVHIIVNFDTISDNHELVSDYYNAKKAIFNSTYDISLHGIKIELYVQDVNSNSMSNGIYSVCDDKWIKHPTLEIPETVADVSKQVEKWKNKLSQILQSDDVDVVQSALDTIYLIRHNGLAVSGEFGAGNMLFKELRNAGFIDDIKQKLKELNSKQLSLEHFDNLNLYGKLYEDQ